jgi:integrase/recombinase XerD
VLALHVIIRFITCMASDDDDDEHPKLHLPATRDERSDLSVHLLQAVPEEDVWVAGQQSAHTRRAYKRDVAHFVAAMNVRSADELRQVTRAAVVAWLNLMKARGDRPRTIRRRLSALSSLFAHLVAHRVADANPLRDVRRPRVNRRQGTTRAFSTKEARKVLDAPDPKSVQGLRDRALLSVGLQAGPRRAEIASLRVRDFHTNRGFKSLSFVRKGGEELSLALNPQTAQRVHDYLAAAGHGDDPDGPLFRPARPNQHRRDPRRHVHPETDDRVLRKYAARVGLDGGYTAHSMRATFITTALYNGASLEDVQRDVGHADPSTTKLYDRRGHDPENRHRFSRCTDAASGVPVGDGRPARPPAIAIALGAEAGTVPLSIPWPRSPWLPWVTSEAPGKWEKQ